MWSPVRTQHTHDEAEQAEATDPDRRSTQRLWWVFAGMALVTAGAGYVVGETAAALVDKTSLSQSAVGTGFAAVANSLPAGDGLGRDSTRCPQPRARRYHRRQFLRGALSRGCRFLPSGRFARRDWLRERSRPAPLSGLSNPAARWLRRRFGLALERLRIPDGARASASSANAMMIMVMSLVSDCRASGSERSWRLCNTYPSSTKFETSMIATLTMIMPTLQEAPVRRGRC
jgi:hypothetical protein